MSARPNPDRAAALWALESMIGRRIPGGCDDCDAFHVLSRCASGAYVLTVHHDNTCPFLSGTTRAGAKR